MTSSLFDWCIMSEDCSSLTKVALIIHIVHDMRGSPMDIVADQWAGG